MMVTWMRLNCKRTKSHLSSDSSSKYNPISLGLIVRDSGGIQFAMWSPDDNNATLLRLNSAGALLTSRPVTGRGAGG